MDKQTLESMSRVNIERLKRVVVISRWYVRSRREDNYVQELKRLINVIDRDAKGEVELSIPEHSRIVSEVEALLRIPLLARANTQSWEELVRDGKAERSEYGIR